MRIEAVPCPADTLRPLRERHRSEMACQILFDQLHTRPGWTEQFALTVDDALAGFATQAIAGPWQQQHAIVEFYVAPEHRTQVFRLFDALIARTGAHRVETQSNGSQLALMLHACSRDVVSDKILFADHRATALPSHGAMLQPVTSEAAIRAAIERRSGGGEWELLVGGAVAGRGGLLFHYNRPYADLYMEIAEPFRRRGLGAYLVQELKQACRARGAIPAARCSPDNLASRQTLQKAGFVPCGHRLLGHFTAVNVPPGASSPPGPS